MSGKEFYLIQELTCSRLTAICAFEPLVRIITWNVMPVERPESGHCTDVTMVVVLLSDFSDGLTYSQSRDNQNI